MKRTWKLFWNSFLISFKHSGRRLLCLLCVFALCAGLLGAYFAAPRQEEPPSRARVGVINLDDNPLSVSMMNTLLEGENLSDLIEVTMLPPDGTGREACTAVITVPQGFLESVLTGENLSPVLEVNLESPLEAMWIRQMALGGARALSSAQLGVYAVLDAVNHGENMDARKYNFLVAEVNLVLLEAFFDRLSLLEDQSLSALGMLTLPQYYAAALAAALLFCYGFLFYPAMADLRRFAARERRCKGVLFLAGTLHILLLEAICTLPLFLLACGGRFTGEIAVAWLLLTLTAGGTALACTQLFPSRASCAAASILLTLGQALCGGLLVPLQLLPEGFSTLAPWLPVWQGMHLLGSALGETPAFGVPLLMSGLLLLLGGLLWTRERRVA